MYTILIQWIQRYKLLLHLQTVVTELYGFKNWYGERTGKEANYQFYGWTDDVINILIIIYLNYINN